MKISKRSIAVIVFFTVILAVSGVVCLYRIKNQQVSVTKMDSLYFYYDDTVRIRLSPAGVDNVYNLFVPGCAHDELMIGYHPEGTGNVVINGEFRVGSGENIIPYIRDISDDGNPYVSIQLLSPTGKEFFNGYINFFFAGNIPSIYISVPEAGIAEINSENPEERLAKLHVSGIMTVVDAAGKTDLCSEIDMSRRGNTSFLHMDVKPYNINLPQTVSILGMRQGRKYALKANSYDMNHLLRTEAAFDMSRLAGMSIMFDSRFADLYINGVYNGLYLITNRIKGDELLELPDIASKPDATGYLLELDYRYENEAHTFVSHDQGIVIHYPENPDPKQMSFIEDRYNKAYEAITADGDYENYIDVDSFVKMYIIQDFLCNVDVDYASFYAYLGEDGLFHAGPIWDLDLACGIMQTLPFHEELALRSHIIPDRGGIFLDILGKSPRFMDKVSSYYLGSFSPMIETYIYEKMQKKGESIYSSLRMADAQHSFHFKDLHSLDSLDGLQEWMHLRNALLNDYFSDPSGYVSVIFHFAWGDIRTLAKKGEPLGYLPDNSHPDNDEAFWGEIEGFTLPDGTTADDGFSPEADTDLYAIYTPDSHAWEEDWSPPS